jgi:hypothetical protein
LGIQLNIALLRIKEYQLRTLRKLLTKAQHTEFGFKHQFTAALNADEAYKAFKSTVPLSDYSSMLPWWERARAGEPNITWPGKMEHFALSSGTSDGASKFLPVSDDMIKAIRKASIRQVLAIARTDVPKDHIAKHWLMIGGSTTLDYNGIYYSGDLSGITTSKIPQLFQRVSKPEPDIRSSTNWEEKITRITAEAVNWDVGMVAGVPAWIQLLFENIIQHYKLTNIHNIWPNLEVYIHGGVSIKPYKSSINNLVGRPIKYFETYLASEGFVAYQNRENAEGGMSMLVRNGIFHEFIPFNESCFGPDGQVLPNAEALPIWLVKEGVEYALVLSTCSGAWRYLIGDTVRFTNLKKKEIVITGRTKHFISLVGEHLSVDNMTEAICRVSELLSIQANEFTMCGVKSNGLFGHQWYVGVSDESYQNDGFASFLDQELCRINDDYAVERKHALNSICATILPLSYFKEWMKLNSKEGSQHKFPRVMKGESLTNWLNFLESKGVEKVDAV